MALSNMLVPIVYKQAKLNRLFFHNMQTANDKKINVKKKAVSYVVALEILKSLGV